MSLLSHCFACFLTWFVPSNFLFGHYATAHRHSAHSWLVQASFVSPEHFFCHSKRSEESSAWILHYARAPFSMTNCRMPIFVLDDELLTAAYFGADFSSKRLLMQPYLFQ